MILKKNSYQNNPAGYAKFKRDVLAIYDQFSCNYGESTAKILCLVGAVIAIKNEIRELDRSKVDLRKPRQMRIWSKNLRHYTQKHLDMAFKEFYTAKDRDML